MHLQIYSEFTTFADFLMYSRHLGGAKYKGQKGRRRLLRLGVAGCVSPPRPAQGVESHPHPA